MIYLIYFGIGLLGMALQIGIKMQSFQSRMRANKLIFKPSQYFSDDWLSIAISFIVLCLWLTFLPDVETKYPAIHSYMRVAMGFMGYGGTSILTWAFSQFDARIKSASEFKAGLAGQVTGTGDDLTVAAKPTKP